MASSSCSEDVVIAAIDSVVGTTVADVVLGGRDNVIPIQEAWRATSALKALHHPAGV